MHVVLFLGSGVSLASGLPGVPQIRETLCYTAKTRVLAFLELLEELDREYLVNSAPYEQADRYVYGGQAYRRQTTYEDLFYLASQMTLSGWGLLADATAGAFTDLMCHRGRDFLKGSSAIARTADLLDLAKAACDFIERTVARLLFCDAVRGLDLILELATSSRISRLDVVTLNHDTLVEQLLTENRIVYADGFSDPDGDIRWYGDAPSRSDARVRIIKPHGSINWYRSGDYRVLQPTILTDRGSSKWRDQGGKPPPMLQSSPSFLTGASKVMSYNRGIFANMLFEFQVALRECRNVVMSGYGWGDTPINFHIQYWLDRDPGNRLILLQKCPRELVDRSKELDEMSRSYRKADRIVFIEEWLMNTSFDRLFPCLVE